MSDVVQRAWDALNQVKIEYGCATVWDSREDDSNVEAMCRQIEALDAERAAHEATKREFSEALKEYAAATLPWSEAWSNLAKYILPDPEPVVDPLEDAKAYALGDNPGSAEVALIETFLGALEANGLTIAADKEAGRG
jgi:hypothetical protein